MKYHVIILSVLLAACSTSGGVEHGGTGVQMRHAVTDQDASPPAPNPQQRRNEEGEIEEGEPIELFSVQPGASFQTSKGVQVDVTSLTASEVSMELEKGEQIAHVSHSGTPLYVEGVAFGQLYRLMSTEGLVTLSFQDTQVTGPLSLQGAAQIAVPAIQERVDCGEAGGVATQADRNGTVLIHGTKEESSRQVEGKTVVCSVRVGLYSREVIQ